MRPVPRPLPAVRMSLLVALAIVPLVLGFAAGARAAVTSSYSEQTLSIKGDAAGDTATVTCSANKMLVNGAQVAGAACDDVFRIDIDLGNGINTADLDDASLSALTNLGEGVVFTGGTGADTFRGLLASPPGFPPATQDHVTGGPGNDTLIGNAGNDDLSGGPGSNIVDAGAGQDSVTEVAADGGAIFSGNTLSYGVSVNDKDTFTSAAAVELISFTGGATDQLISLASFPGRTFLNGGGGQDTITGTANDDTILGGAGADTVYGNDGDDHVYGGHDDDTLHGGGGGDTIYGGMNLNEGRTGVDQLLGDAGSDKLELDTSLAGSMADGGADSDVVWASSSTAQTVKGGGGNGQDELTGRGSGILTNAAFAAVTMEAIEQVMVLDAVDVDASAFTKPLAMYAHTTTPAKLIGGQGKNTITGGTKPDVIVGGPIADTLKAGGGGPDTITGGGGADVLQGSLSFSGDTLRETEVPSAKVTATKLDRAVGDDDTITDFEVVDLTGTGAGDVIDASAFGGRALLRGAGGDDTLTGTAKDDLLDAGTGVDVLTALGGGDTIKAANTTLTTIDCGTGIDKGDRDAGDAVKDCETLAVTAQPTADGPGNANQNESTTKDEGPGGPTVTPPGPERPGVTPPALRARLFGLVRKVRKGRLSLTVGCAPAKACRGSVTVRTVARRGRKGRSLLERTFTASPAGQVRLNPKLGPAARKRLAAAGKNGLRAIVTVKVADGGAATRRVVLRVA